MVTQLWRAWPISQSEQLKYPIEGKFFQGTDGFYLGYSCIPGTNTGFDTINACWKEK